MDTTYTGPKSNPFFRYPLITFVCFSAVIILIGFLYYGKQRHAIYHYAQDELSVVSKLKTNQINWWIEEKKRDANALKHDLPAIWIIHKYFTDKSEKEKSWIFHWMKEFRKQYDYQSIALFDRNVELQLADGDVLPIMDEKALALSRRSLEQKEIVLTDIHRHGPATPPHLSIFIPLSISRDAGEATPVGLFMLIVDPAHFLFPLMQEWPSPSPTAETLLVEKEGNNVVFLNQLRHVENKPLDLRLPMQKQDLPATMAVQGRTGIVKGFDYRGIQVLADIHPVPHTKWFIVCKIDMAEIEQPLHKQALSALIAALSVIMATGGILGYLTHQEKTKYYRSMYASEREKAEVLEVLRQNDERIRTYFDESLIGMAIISPQKEWLQVNKKLCEMLGYSFQELKEIPWHKLAHPDDRKIDAQRFDQLVSGEINGYMIDRRFIKKDGSLIYTTLSIKAIQSETGAVDYCVVQLIDITEQKEAILERVQIDKLSSLGLLVAGVAHELNNPLMGIINYAQANLALESESDKIVKNLKNIERQTRRCIGIVERLLTFAHADTVDKDQPQPINTLSLVNQVLDLLSYRLRQKEIMVHVDASHDLRDVEMAAEKFQQLVLNLVTNAIDALEGRDRRAIHIRLETDNREFRFSIEDTGCGILQGDENKVFDPFFTTKPVGTGTGLGLSTCWAILNEYQGDISFQSTPGAGTIFVVKIPVTYYAAS